MIQNIFYVLHFYTEVDFDNFKVIFKEKVRERENDREKTIRNFLMKGFKNFAWNSENYYMIFMFFKLTLFQNSYYQGN